MTRLLIAVTVIGLLVYAWGAIMGAAFRKDYGGSLRQFVIDTNLRIKRGEMTYDDIRPELERRAEMKTFEDAYADLDATMRQPGQRGTYGGRRP